MPYQTCYDGPILVVRFFGTVTESDLVGSADEVMALEDRGRNTRPRLTDLRGISDSPVGYAEVANIADRVGYRPLASPIRSAFLVDRPVQLGFARMFQTLNRHPQVTIGIFEDEAAARHWLIDGAADAPDSVAPGERGEG
jgi:hypothetical protein